MGSDDLDMMHRSLSNLPTLQEEMCDEIVSFVEQDQCNRNLEELQRMLRQFILNKRLFIQKRLFLHKRDEEENKRKRKSGAVRIFQMNKKKTKRIKEDFLKAKSQLRRMIQFTRMLKRNRDMKPRKPFSYFPLMNTKNLIKNIWHQENIRPRYYFLNIFIIFIIFSIFSSVL